MITYPMAFSVAQAVGCEPLSALPDAPIVSEAERAPRGRVTKTVRWQLTTALRWIADALEPEFAEALQTASRSRTRVAVEGGPPW
jgi:hypothetical protein